MREDRKPANIVILKCLDILSRKFPHENIEDLIERFCFSRDCVVFYEESVDTADYIKRELIKFSDVQEGVQAQINGFVLKKIRDIIERVPDQRFGQIYENYIYGMKFQTMEWLSEMDVRFPAHEND